VENFREIVKKIETPLTFLSKDSYRNLHLIKNFETTMSGLIDRLKTIKALSGRGDVSKSEFGNIISDLDKAFFNFDNLSLVDKKERIAKALRLVNEMRYFSFDTKTEKSPDASGTKENLNTRFEKLSLPVQYIKGVGPRIAQLLSKKSLKTVEDMLYFLPRKYEDRRFVKKISQAQVGSRETVVGEVINAQIQQYRRKKIFEVTIDDGSGLLTAKWFKGSHAYLRKTFKKGVRVIFTGEVREFLLSKDIIHPDFEILSGKDETTDDFLHFKRIVPIYSETEGNRACPLRFLNSFC